MATLTRAITLGFFLALAAPAAAAARKPLPATFLSRNVCPFECCVYRRWAARRPIVVYARERRTAQIVFTIAAGDSFDALTGNVHVPRTGVARVLRAFQFGSGAGRAQLVPGDRLALLERAGEGTTHVWVDGKEAWLELDALASPAPGGGRNGRPYVRILRHATSAWWVRVRALDGREGYILADDGKADDYAFDNADDCG